MIAVTAATGHLGHLVVEHLLRNLAPAEVAACGRNLGKAGELRTWGVDVRRADYEDPASLDKAFAGIERLLLISSSEVGRRARQHRNAIDAAKRQGVKLVIYTSLLHADHSPITSLAVEHCETEEALKRSGVPYVLLRNGWYTENYTASVAPAIAHHVFYGSAESGKISSATRNDYAEAAAKVIASGAEPGTVFELAGDEAYTLADVAAEISRETGLNIRYENLPEAAYRQVLVRAGLPDGLAAAIASYDVGAAQNALFDDSHQLSRLIGRPTTRLRRSVAEAVRAAGGVLPAGSGPAKS
jgi:NAD(P)H dehydrogenase (quinone)